MTSTGLKNRLAAIQWMVLLAALALACLPTAAQSSQQGGSSQDDSQANQSNGAQNPANNTQQDANTPPEDVPFSGMNSVTPPQTQIYQLGTTNLLSSQGRYHWGPLSLGSSDVRAAVDIIRPTSAAEGPAQNDFLSLLETSINIDQQFGGGRNRFTLQYLPRVAITNGQVAYDYLNQNVGINSYFLLSSRWTLGLSDRFLVTSNQGLTGGYFADASAVTSTTLQNVFLNTNDTYLTNIAAATFSYSSSPRTIISFAPSLVYQHTSGLDANLASGSSAPSDSFSSLNLGLDSRFRYLVDARTSVGAYSSISFVQFNGVIPTSEYYTFGVSASRQLTMTTGVTLDLGLTDSVFQSQQYWSPTGTITFFKVFPRGRISAVYTRGLPSGGYVSNNLTQRVDVIAHYLISPRLIVDAGFGYESQDSGPEVVSGKYGTAEMDYVLAPRWTVFGTYAYKLQDSNNIQVFAGTTNFASFGLRWNPNWGLR